jgi:hypothetical protein
MFSDIFSYLFTRDRATQGVVATLHPSYSSNFDETHTGGTITVGNGIGMVDGKIYATDASIQFSPASDGDWSVILRKSWGSQTVRMLCVAYGTTVQTDGVTWDVELYRVTRSGGNITVVKDLRGWALRPRTQVIPHRYIANGGVSGMPSTWFNDGTGLTMYIDFVIPTDYVTDLEIWAITGGTTNGTGTIKYQAVVDHWYRLYGVNDPRMAQQSYGVGTVYDLNIHAAGYASRYAYKIYDHVSTDNNDYVIAGKGLNTFISFVNVAGGTYGGSLTFYGVHVIYKGI